MNVSSASIGHVNLRTMEGIVHPCSCIDAWRQQLARPFEAHLLQYGGECRGRSTPTPTWQILSTCHAAQALDNFAWAQYHTTLHSPIDPLLIPILFKSPPPSLEHDGSVPELQQTRSHVCFVQLTRATKSVQPTWNPIRTLLHWSEPPFAAQRMGPAWRQS